MNEFDLTSAFDSLKARFKSAVEGGIVGADEKGADGNRSCDHG